jgi:hypothetical protein
MSTVTERALFPQPRDEGAACGPEDDYDGDGGDIDDELCPICGCDLLPGGYCLSCGWAP